MPRHFVTLLFLLSMTALRAASPESVFGTTESHGGALIGMLYDLKQTQQHTPTGMTLPGYGKVVDEFISNDWSETILNRYYRVARPLFTTQIFIPLMPASAGPKAFGAEGQIQPSLWLIHYKGQVSAPSNGSWRFWGYGGEICVVAINGKTVLLANHPDVKTPHIIWKSPEPPGQPAGSGRLIAGDWIDLKAGQVVDLDVLIGERGGGTFDCFLQIEKRGDPLATTTDHFPILPIFQVAPYDTAAPASAKVAPRFAKNGPVWTAVQ